MFKQLAKFWKKYVLRKKTLFTIDRTTDDSVPLHIRTIGRLYPILHTVVCNQARGEIKKFHFVESQKNTLRVGHHVTTTEGDYDCLWVCLGNDYFKLILKA